MIIDKDLFSDLLENYTYNVQQFKKQNSGLIVNNVQALTEADLEKFIKNTLHIDDGTIDKQFIHEHFKNFAISPIVSDMQKGFSVQVDLIPDVICEYMR